MVKWIAVDRARAGLRHAVMCPNMTGRTKERIAQSKRARAGSFAIVDWPQVARTFILWAFGLQMPCCFSLILRLLCFVTTVCVLFRFYFFLFLFLWRYRLFRVFLYHHYRFIFYTAWSMESTSYVFPFFPDGAFLLCDHGLDILHHQLM